MKYKVPKKEPVSRIGFECSSRFKFKPGMSLFFFAKVKFAALSDVVNVELPF